MVNLTLREANLKEKPTRVKDLNHHKDLRKALNKMEILLKQLVRVKDLNHKYLMLHNPLQDKTMLNPATKEASHRIRTDRVKDLNHKDLMLHNPLRDKTMLNPATKEASHRTRTDRIKDLNLKDLLLLRPLQPQAMVKATPKEASLKLRSKDLSNLELLKTHNLLDLHKTLHLNKEVNLIAIQGNLLLLATRRMLVQPLLLATITMLFKLLLKSL